MTRIVMVSGKGGVGKSTVAAATGLAAARRGHRTLVLSFDLAHSLSDAFDLHESLFSQRKGEPFRIADRLDLQEIDVQEELQRDWSELYQYSASLMVGGGLEGLVAEEVAIVPGLEDVVALIRLNQYLAEDRYDLIVLDSPPTAEALRFVSITSSLGWYARKRLSIDRRISSLLRPMGRLSEAMNLHLPEDSYFGSLKKLFERLEGVEEKLRDPAVTTVRLVTNPEKMVMRETQRAFMYLCMYGMTVDAVVVNRLLPRSEGYFRAWAEAQEEASRRSEEYFDPVPVRKLPLLAHEVVGQESLEEFGRLLHGDLDPAGIFVEAPPYGFAKTGEGRYVLEIPLPFAERRDVDIARQSEDLVVRIGTFKRNILLPRVIAPLATTGARMEGRKLVVEFAAAGG